jgi:hypothetical protein
MGATWPTGDGGESSQCRRRQDSISIEQGVSGEKTRLISDSGREIVQPGFTVRAGETRE